MTGQGQSPVEPVVSAHDLAVALVAMQLGLMVLCALVGLFAVVQMLGDRR
jgi:hypothetical protein